MITRIVVYGTLIASILLTPVAYSKQVDKVQGQEFENAKTYIEGCYRMTLVQADNLSKQQNLVSAIMSIQYAFASIVLEALYKEVAKEEANWYLNFREKLTYKQMWERFLGKDKIQYMQLVS